VIPAGNGNGDDGRKRDQSRVQNKERAAHYRARAAECLRLAEQSTDPAGREQWVEIANGWTQLALHAERHARS
jgi:hypothetical protein